MSESVSGRIVLYGHTAPDDTHNIALQFNNITQWLCYEDFLALEWNVRCIDANAYFDAHPHEDRVHLSTPSRYLSFSFRPNELVELRQMLGRAVARLHWIETLRNAQN
ncbi:hypothetical protein [Spirosoma oryzicola]|uniref:hypothetical protein n=1 Tax=Spirosoma oryzicola TaxID=2898794 RepID=UPI001E57F692|nr:hypothetical protein [Spirosoma oryzicola]UHG91925.1 hypothetical protein LQ777_03245 [Spirosoma oryzicola]